ncbi:outer membrane protein, partial [Enterobacter ludwigii]|uniref:outer membrane protein n=1 Tax=Enterobacter ludwigii TaxID=299767 RepID=UPI0013D2FD26
FFATAGAANGWLGAQVINSSTVPLGKTYSKLGWTVGAGIEHAFTPNWTAKLEYAYTSYGGTQQICCLGGTFQGSSQFFNTHT